MPRKKIIHIINSLEQGGTETTLFRLLECSRLDYEMHVIVLQGPGFFSKKIADLDIPVHHLNIHKKNVIIRLFTLHRLLKKLQADVVQTWLYHANLLGGLLAKINHTPKIIWNIRCEGKFLKKSTQIIQQLAAYSSRHIPDLILYNSQAAIDYHHQRHYCHTKAALIYNGINTHQFYPKKTSHASPKITIGSLGRLHPDKNYHQFIAAIDIVCKQHPQVYFKICGHRCAQLSSIRNTLQYAEHLELIDGCEDPLSYFHSLDAFILPSITEGFPNALAEAMACALPCIASDIGAIPQILGDAGILIPDPNSLAIAQSCLHLLQLNPKQRQQLGIKAYNRIHQQYSFDNYYLKLKTIYNS